MILADSCMDCLRGYLATLSVLIVRIALQEYSKIHEKAYKCRVWRLYYVMREKEYSTLIDSLKKDLPIDIKYP